MPAHRSEATEGAGSRAYQAVSTSAEVADTSKCDTLIEDYLDRVMAPTIGVLPLPYEARLKRPETMRADIEKPAAAHRELGLSVEEAVSAALRQYGDVTVVAHRGLSEKTVRTTGRTLPSARPATLLALPLFAVPWLADQTGLAWRLWTRLFLQGRDVECHNGVCDALYYRFILFAVPLMSGFVVGALCRSRASRGVVCALGLLFVVAIEVPAIITGFELTGIVNVEAAPDFLTSIWAKMAAASVGLPFWVGLGCGGAALGGGYGARGGNPRQNLTPAALLR